MHIFLTVLAWIGRILLGALALALLVPVRVSAEWREGRLSVRVWLLLAVCIRVLPLPEKTGEAQRKKRPEKARAPKPPKEGAKAEKKLRITFGLVADLLSAAGVFMRRVFRALHFRRIIVVLPVHREDAADTAIACGQTTAALSAGIALLENFLDLRFDCVHVLPDFTGGVEAGPYLAGDVVAFPVMFFLAGLFALGRFLSKH